MADLELIKRLNDFYIYATQGFYIDKIIDEKKYKIAYSSNVQELDSNYAASLCVNSKEEFNFLSKEIKEKMAKLNRKICYLVSPLDNDLYNNRNEFFENNGFIKASNEVWQIFDDFDKINEIEVSSNLKIELEKTTNMEKFAVINTECFCTGDKEDPYGALETGFIDVYKNYKEKENSKYKIDFFYIKLNESIIGSTVSIYGEGICRNIWFSNKKRI